MILNFLFQFPRTIKDDNPEEKKSFDSDQDSKINLVVPNAAIEWIENNISHKHKRKEKAHQFLHFFCSFYLTNVKNLPYHAFARIHSEKIYKHLRAGKLHKTLKENLFDTTFHRSGKYSKGYRFKKKFLQSGYKLIPYKLSPIINHKHEEETKNHAYLEHYSQIIKRLDFSKCTLKNQELLKDLQETGKRKIQEITEPTRSEMFKVNWQRSKYPFKKGEKLVFKKTEYKNLLDIESKLCYERFKYRIHKERFALKVTQDNTTFRTHHILTRLPSCVVKHTRLNNEKLVEIDMANCHYALLSNVLFGSNQQFLNELTKANPKLKDITPRLHKSFNTKLSNINDRYVLRPRSLEFADYKDLREFIEWSFSGRLYDNIKIEMVGDGLRVNRTNVKIMLMEVFYGRYSADYSKAGGTEWKEWFCVRFPTVCKIVNDFKKFVAVNWNSIELEGHPFYSGVINAKLGKNRTDSEGGKISLSILLMNYESDLFTQKVLPRLWEQGIDAITKHDSILVVESQLHFCIQIIEEIFIDSLGEGNFKLCCD